VTLHTRAEAGWTTHGPHPGTVYADLGEPELVKEHENIMQIVYIKSCSKSKSILLNPERSNDILRLHMFIQNVNYKPEMFSLNPLGIIYGRASLTTISEHSDKVREVGNPSEEYHSCRLFFLVQHQLDV
jgi:hypothetical protein